MQSYEPDEPSRILLLYGEQSEAGGVEFVAYAREKLGRLGFCQPPYKELHHTRVVVHLYERYQIVACPPSQIQAFRLYIYLHRRGFFVVRSDIINRTSEPNAIRGIPFRYRRFRRAIPF